MKILMLLLFCAVSRTGICQLAPFPVKGQMPSNAFPVCGIDTFRQLTLPSGTGGHLDIPGCGLVEIRDPYYYSFTCYAPGKLAIQLNNINQEQDLNWELFDITGRNADEILTDPSLAIIGNWAGTYGRTGARLNGVPDTKCLSDPALNDSTFSESPSLILGHHYLLLVSSYKNSQGGYLVAFAGSTAVISDSTSPHILSAYSGCEKNILKLAVNKEMRCYSLASDGSDFIIAGNPATIVGAQGLNCNSQFDFDTIQLTFSAPLPEGSYSLIMKSGSDGNTMMDNCGNQIPEGESINFNVKVTDTLSADFNYSLREGCQQDTIAISYSSVNTVSNWQWLLNSTPASTLYEPVIIRSDLQTSQLTHIVSNGFCSDTSTKMIIVDEKLKAAFDSPAEVCPKDAVQFSNTSSGQIVSWLWDFGDGSMSDEMTPAGHIFPDTRTEAKYFISLVVKNDQGCADTIRKSIIKLQTCVIQVPSAFTPNGDNKNDFLYPLNGNTATNIEFRVFNRLGQLVFESRDGSKKWDGSINGVPQSFGTFVWTLHYTDRNTGKNFSLTGTTVLVR